MSLSNRTPTPVTPEQIATAIADVERVLATFAYVERLTPEQRKQNLKIRRGAHQVIPQFTGVARTFDVRLRGVSADDLDAALAHARALEPLLSTVAVRHATLADEYLTSQGEVWKRAMALYVMLRSAATTHVDLATSLETVKAWFRYRRAKKASAPVAATPGGA